MFRDLPITARELKATPAMLERIYEGAKLGLRGDSLALAAGMLPVELARLKLMDPIAEIAEMKGRADSEMTMSRTLYEAAEVIEDAVEIRQPVAATLARALPDELGVV